MANFLSALEVPMDEIERPKAIPLGTYVAQIVGLPTSRDVTVKGEEQETLNINCKLLSPMGDVDRDQLSAYGDITTARALQRTFWFHKPPTPEELWGYSQFAKNTLKMETKGKTVKQVAAEMQGKQLLVTVTHSSGTDKNTGEPVVFSNVGSTAAL